MVKNEKHRILCTVHNYFCNLILVIKRTFDQLCLFHQKLLLCDKYHLLWEMYVGLCNPYCGAPRQ